MTLASATSTGEAARPRRRHRLLWLLIALLLLAAVTAASLLFGTRVTSPQSVLAALFAFDPNDNDQLVIRELRIPRTIIGLSVGATLGLAGTIMQGITRNPLADPGLLGVNSGASLSVVFAISLFGITSPSGYIWFAFAGAAAAASIVYGIGSIGREGATPVKLALAGTALTAAITSIITLVLISDLDTLGTYRFWSVGSLASRGLDTLAQLLPFIIVGAGLAFIAGPMLNMLSLGDDLARGLGQNLIVSRVVCGVAVVLLCGAATAVAGPIVFVGLVVPHLVRPFTGPDYRWVLAYSVVVGAALLLAADVIGRLIVYPGELEAGLVVALLGAPVMIALVRRVKLAGL